VNNNKNAIDRTSISINRMLWYTALTMPNIGSRISTKVNPILVLVLIRSSSFKQDISTKKSVLYPIMKIISVKNVKPTDNGISESGRGNSKTMKSSLMIKPIDIELNKLKPTDMRIALNKLRFFGFNNLSRANPGTNNKKTNAINSLKGEIPEQIATINIKVIKGMIKVAFLICNQLLINTSNGINNYHNC
jgi:hypothetical protein